MRGFLLFLMICAVVCSGCAIQEIDSDFPSVYPADEYYPLMHFEHLTDFRHLQTEWPLLLTEEMTQC